MPRNEAQEANLRCYKCGSDNYPYASFCIACGEPLDSLELEGLQVGLLESSNSSLPTFQQSNPPLATRHSPLVRWETWIGLAILLLVIGYAVWEWQRDVTQSAAYREGVAAQQNKHWDEAMSAFARAGEHSDAPHRKVEVLQKVTERDRSYDEGLQAEGRRDLSTAIASFEKVEDIQPSYRDSADRLAQDRAEALRVGLGDIVYLVDDGPGAGLYIRDRRGRATLLPRSDKQSAVRAISPEGTAFIYDWPSKETDYFAPPATHRSIVLDPFGPDKTDRMPILARVGGDGKVTTVPLPRLKGAGTGVFTSKGLWWHSDMIDEGTGVPLQTYEVYYYIPDLSEPLSTVRFSSQEIGRFVIAVDPVHEKLVTAEWLPNTANAESETRLYLASMAAPGAGTLLQTVRGEVQDASISHDGRWLLYMTVEKQDLARVHIPVNYVKIAWTLPLDQGDESNIWPRWLAAISAFATTYVLPDASLTAAFVPSEDKQPKVIVSRTEQDTERLVLYDLDDRGSSSTASLWSGERYGPFISQSSFSHDTRYFVSERRHSEGKTLEIVGIRPESASWSAVKFPADLYDGVQPRFSPRDDYIVARAGILGLEGKIYAAPLDKDKRPGEPKLIAQVQREDFAISHYYNNSSTTIAMPAEGLMLMYINTKLELHAVFYNGTSDTLVAGNVKAMWDLQGGQDLSWDR